MVQAVEFYLSSISMRIPTFLAAGQENARKQSRVAILHRLAVPGNFDFLGGKSLNEPWLAHAGVAPRDQDNSKKEEVIHTQILYARALK